MPTAPLSAGRAGGRLARDLTPGLVPAAAILFLAGPALECFPLSAAAILPLLAVTLGAERLWRDPVAWRSLAAGMGWILVPIAYMLISANWAPDGEAALRLALRLALLGFATFVAARAIAALPPRATLALLAAAAAGLALAAGLATLDLLGGNPLAIWLHPARAALAAYAYSRGSAFQALAALPVACGLWRAGHRGAGAGLFLVALASILVGIQLSAKLALGLGAAATLAVAALPVLRWALPALLLIAAGGTPWLFPLFLPGDGQCWLAAHKPSALHRLYIWNFVGAKIGQRPWLGWGLDAARRLPGGQTVVAIRDCAKPFTAAPILRGQLLPLHPHNAILQVWVELGGLGAAIVFGCVAGLMVRAFRDPAGGRWGRAVAAGMVVAAVSVSAFSFGVWQEWWLAALGLAIALVQASRRSMAETAAEAGR